MPPDKGKRYAISFRATKEDYEAIRNLAETSGRSIAQELEFRISASIAAADRLAAIEARLTAIEALLRWRNVS